MKKVSQRNAPGAMSAIALEVNPVKPRVEGGFFTSETSGISNSFVLGKGAARPLRQPHAELRRPSRLQGRCQGPARGLEAAETGRFHAGPFRKINILVGSEREGGQQCGTGR